ncbi:Glycoside hydrolase superfamily [Rhypophila decipiens]
MKFTSHMLALASLSFQLAASSTIPSSQNDINPRQQNTWPNGPFVTDGRNIRDTTGANIKYAGVNWPGHGEVMIPEGLQYQSIATIVSKIGSSSGGIGLNAIRLTFAIQMVDEIYANGGKDITLQKAFVQGLGQTNGTRVLNQVLAKNPQFTVNTTRLEVFDAVAAECYRQKIYVHIDNHISKGMWCCGTGDGNSWWGDTYFDAQKWSRGLAYMASHAKTWPAFVSLSLRNEPREPTSNPSLAKSTYNWQTWNTYMRQGAAAVHAANPDILIFLSGLNYDTTLTPVVRNQALSPSQTKFNLADFPGGPQKKIVLELHNYETGATSCSSLQNNLYNNGFQSMASNPGNGINVFPVMLTEFGFAMDANTYKGVYATCLANYLPTQTAGWFIWVLVGSYYVREGIQNYDEAWGLFTRDWTNWRSTGYVNGVLAKMARDTLAR